MAAEIIISAILPIIRDRLISPAIQELGVLSGADDKLRKLERILGSIQPALVDAKERQVADTNIKNWLSSLKEVAYEAEDLLDDFDYEAQRKSLSKDSMGRKVLHFYKPIKTRYSLCRRLNKTITKMEAIADEIKRFTFKLNREPQISYHHRPQTHSYVDEKTIVGREKDKEDIVSSLINHVESNDKKIMVLPIVAMGGMGKTTLSQLVYNDHRVESHFQVHMWVCVSDVDFDVARLVRLIIEAATKEECNISNMELLQDRLRKIISGTRYLIVLDDVWNENQDQWDGLKILLDCGGDGSAVVVSTRSTIAAQIMATHLIHDLKQLSEEDTWELFRRRVFTQGAEEPINLVKIGKDIIKRCGGLPLAIATLGSMMGRLQDDEEKWKAVLDSEIWEMKSAKDNILPALRLSYNYLPSHLKQCFSFCAIYPKDYVMEKNTMIQMWMANGFIPSNGKGDLDAIGRDFFDELVWRSFFQNVEEFGSFRCIFLYTDRKYINNITVYRGEVKFKIHDLMHDLAHSIMGEEFLYLPTISNWDDIPSTAKHLSIRNHSNFIPSNPSVIPTIRTITELESHLFERRSPNKFLSLFKALRVLDLQLYTHHNLRQVHSPYFKFSAGVLRGLRHLRLLDMSHSDISDLPEGICSLYNLQTLKLSGCQNLKNLPDNLTDLVNLRHLYIDGCDKLICMPRGMRRLKQLHTLTTYIVGVESERGIDQLGDMNLCGTLQLYNIEKVSNALDAEYANISSKENLHSIMLSWEGIGSLEVFEALKPHNRLRMLAVHDYKGNQFPRWMNYPQQLQNLVHIILFGCEKCKELPPFGHLPFLEVLELDGIYEVKHIINKKISCDEDLHTTLFPSLKKLRMLHMENLEGWCEAEEINAQVVPDKRQFLHCLMDLTIAKCNNLKTIPVMPSLQILCLTFCNPNLTNMFSFTLDGRPNLSELQELVLRNCDGLVSLPDGMKNLTRLEIRECNGLTSLPEGLIKLCFLSLDRFSGLVSLPKGMEGLISLSISECNGLTSLPDGLEKLDLLILNRCDGLVSLPYGMENLTRLEILECDGLTSFPMGLIKLRSLKLDRCDGLVSLPEGMEGLTSLSISKCNGLASLPGGLIKLYYLKLDSCGGLVSLPEEMEGLMHLIYLIIINCERLRSLPEGFLLQLPNLFVLTITGHDELIRPLQSGGDYWHLIKKIRHRSIEQSLRSLESPTSLESQQEIECSCLWQSLQRISLM